MDANILIVDNIPGQRRALENMLKEAGCTKVRASNDAKEAMAIITSEPGINTVITEWDLPGKSGIELLTLIKSNDKLHAIPVFLTFKIKSKDEILKASQAGAAGFIVKPYKLEVIKQKNKEILKTDDIHEVPKDKTLNLDNTD